MRCPLILPTLPLVAMYHCHHVNYLLSSNSLSTRRSPTTMCCVLFPPYTTDPDLAHYHLCHPPIHIIKQHYTTLLTRPSTRHLRYYRTHDEAQTYSTAHHNTTKGESTICAHAPRVARYSRAPHPYSVATPRSTASSSTHQRRATLGPAQHCSLPGCEQMCFVYL